MATQDLVTRSENKVTEHGRVSVLAWGGGQSHVFPDPAWRALDSNHKAIPLGSCKSH